MMKKKNKVKEKKKRILAKEKKKQREQKRLIERSIRKKDRALDKISQSKIMPIVNEDKREEYEMKVEARNAKIKKQLELNMKRLEALEQEYIDEQLKREEVNAELEARGCKTAKDKIEYMKKMGEQMTSKAIQEAMEKAKDNSSENK